MTTLSRIKSHQTRLKTCRRCEAMHGPPVVGQPVASPVMLIGQAPGDKEIEVARPFAWTAGKTLFKWFESIGLTEDVFRSRVYMAAVCRCFPGKHPKGGDRVPSDQEIRNCHPWMVKELELTQSKLLLPVGKLAIGQFMPVTKLVEFVGQRFTLTVEGQQRDIIPLPHPSGASTWHRTQPGKDLLAKALSLIKRHAAWRSIVPR